LFGSCAQINEWVKSRDPYGKIIPFSASFEATVCAFGDDDTARKEFLADKKVKSMIPKIITTGYSSLDLIQYFTVGEVEVRAWTVKKGTLAPGAAGVIHSDFMKHFICAETMAFDDFKHYGSEAEVKKAGKFKTQGKLYVVHDGDILSAHTHTHTRTRTHAAGARSSRRSGADEEQHAQSGELGMTVAHSICIVLSVLLSAPPPPLPPPPAATSSTTRKPVALTGGRSNSPARPPRPAPPCPCRVIQAALRQLQRCARGSKEFTPSAVARAMEP